MLQNNIYKSIADLLTTSFPNIYNMGISHCKLNCLFYTFRYFSQLFVTVRNLFDFVVPAHDFRLPLASISLMAFWLEHCQQVPDGMPMASARVALPLWFPDGIPPGSGEAR